MRDDRQGKGEDDRRKERRRHLPAQIDGNEASDEQRDQLAAAARGEPTRGGRMRRERGRDVHALAYRQSARRRREPRSKIAGYTAVAISVTFCPPKPKLLDRAAVHFVLAGLVGDVVEVALRVGRLVVDRRRQHAVADRQQADDQLRGPGGARSGGPSCSWCWRPGSCRPARRRPC